MEVVTASSTIVTLQWMPPKYPNGVITRYAIQFDGIIINEFGDYVAGKMIGSIDRLTPHTEYVFEMKAYTRVGPGSSSSLSVRTCKLMSIVMHTYFSQVFKVIHS